MGTARESGAAKFYLSNIITNSQNVVTNIAAIYPLFDAMQTVYIPLLIYGKMTIEVMVADIDILR